MMRDTDTRNLRNRLSALQRNRASCRPEDADAVNEADADIAVIEEELERFECPEEAATRAWFEALVAAGFGLELIRDGKDVELTVDEACAEMRANSYQTIYARKWTHGATFADSRLTVYTISGGPSPVKPRSV